MSVLLRFSIHRNHSNKQVCTQAATDSFSNTGKTKAFCEESRMNTLSSL
uniref:Uncharacterized protein n=1 Tax=Anguilla anguilla TaxID=7936 RepID=A0A0E9S7W4_ANGAN